MADTTPQPAATAAGQSIALYVTGYPDVPNRWGAGHIRATVLRLDYGNARTLAGRSIHLTGLWVREDGEATDATIDQHYDAPDGDTSEWPDWIAELAREHDPDATTAPSAPADRAVRRERYAAAIRETDGWVLDGGKHMIDAVMAVADTERAEMREQHKASLRRADEINNELMEEVQRYAAGTERPVLWSVYNEMHLRADNAEAAITRVRRLHDRLAEETDLTSPDDSITRGAAAKQIATAVDGWNPAGLPGCDVEFEGGGRCAKPAGHRPPGSDDPHVPEPAAVPPHADRAAVLDETAALLEAQSCTCGCRRGAEFMRQRAAVIRAADARRLAADTAGRSDVGSEFAHQVDHLDVAGLDVVDAGLAAEAPEPATQDEARRAELDPVQLLAAHPDEPLPQTERLVGGRRLRSGDATVDPAVCPRCKGDNSEAFELCATCATAPAAVQTEEA